MKDRPITVAAGRIRRLQLLQKKPGMTTLSTNRRQHNIERKHYLSILNYMKLLMANVLLGNSHKLKYEQRKDFSGNTFYLYLLLCIFTKKDEYLSGYDSRQ